ncbi:hypothetical protein [Clostridium carboxidivorans]|uniref:hypothetical protein n=1 Tax=Clostridium carboxidivorans TaxID=217159 RepID=UPI0001D392BF|nr:hypothetical protein [Clostridium carboxidivorans]EFG87463.1 hypothetical protein CLCAR_2996 [Clostridium carboxidivorans P7]
MKVNKFKCNCGCHKFKTLVLNIRKNSEILKCTQCGQKWVRTGSIYKEQNGKSL